MHEGVGARFAGLHVLADDDPRWPADPVEQARAACEGGADVVQLRAKHATDAEAIAMGRAIRRCCSEAGARFVFNDRFDLALACEADAVHLGQGDLPPDRIPDTARRKLAIGRSTHTLEQARATLLEPIDYVAFGPLYGTHSKQSEYGSRGASMLKAVAEIVAPRVLVAIGGIGLDEISATLGAGAQGVAVISAVVAADEPVSATRALIREIARCSARERGLD